MVDCIRTNNLTIFFLKIQNQLTKFQGLPIKYYSSNFLRSCFSPLHYHDRQLKHILHNITQYAIKLTSHKHPLMLRVFIAFNRLFKTKGTELLLPWHCLHSIHVWIIPNWNFCWKFNVKLVQAYSLNFKNFFNQKFQRQTARQWCSIDLNSCVGNF